MEQALAALDALYLEIDRGFARLAEQHAPRLRCGAGCHDCCVDALEVTPLEAERIVRRHGDWLARAAPHEPGACAFLDREGRCRIYADRPAVCRSQGLPLRLLFEDERGEIEERRDICPLNEPGGPRLESLPEEDCWLVGPVEWRLGVLSRDAFGEGAPRVALRALFGRPHGPPTAGAAADGDQTG